MSFVPILSEGDRRLVLTRAMLMYQNHSRDLAYATIHTFDTDADNPERRIIGAGTPMTKAALAEFARTVHASTAYAGFVPENLVYASPGLIAWWVPAAIRMTWFKCTEMKQLRNAAGPAAHPALVFVATTCAWYVFALDQSERPRAQTQLFHAPHMNVGDNGQICTGNVVLPSTLSAETIAGYENAFFRSHFTHPNHDRGVHYKGGMYALWRDQLKSPDLHDIRCALLPANESLQAAIKRISTTNRT